MSRAIERGPEWTLHHCTASELARRLKGDGFFIDHLCFDAPYSEKTHAGHDDSLGTSTWAGQSTPNQKKRINRSTRAGISYRFWTADDINQFVEEWVPLTKGWVTTLTDTVLAPIWDEALKRAGLYTFAPIACVEPGSRVRLAGDGPSQWSVQLVAARPKSLSRWGSLPGAYVVPRGFTRPRIESGEEKVIGAKSTWLMERIVEDYSRYGDVVCDPTAGGGTTLLAARRLGRRALGSEVDRATYQLAVKALQRPYQRPMFTGEASAPEQSKGLE